MTDAPADAVVIGSGFGGAIVAGRLAEAGYRVVVLERGRRWSPADFPRAPGDAWVWDQHHPERANGWLDFRVFPRMAVAQGAGVGGGSLIYANISVEADSATFATGWPREITSEVLAPHYATVGRMLNVQSVPEGQWPARTTLMHEAAAAAGYGDRFRPLDLAVNFDPGWDPNAPGAHEPGASRRFRNAFGIEQGTCIHLGECDIGCPVMARNTLDVTYLALAEAHGADVRPLHLVRGIDPVADGYRVRADRIADGRLEPTTVTGRIAIVAAGSLGSTELLLRCRDIEATMPDLPRALGQRWSANGDFLTIGIHPSRRVLPTQGPTITSAIDFRDGSIDGHAFLIEDGGFPDLLRAWLERSSGRFPRLFRDRWVAALIRKSFATETGIDHLMPWFAQGRDAADGKLRLRRRWWFMGPRRLGLDWNPRKSLPTLDAIADVHRRLAAVTDGTTATPPTWALAKYLITPHPLGGCSMGSSMMNSVVDHRGEVWGRRNLFVTDGAIVPTAIGANPSRTIGALAERIAGLIVQDGR